MYNEYLALASRIKGLDLGDYLEFGCGDGGFLKYVLDLNDSFKSVTAVDINPESVKQARITLENYNVQFIIQEILPLGLEAGHFSYITLSNTLHHLKDKPLVFAELKRLIRKSGRIIITEMISDQLTLPEQVYCLFHGFRARIDRLNDVYHDTTYTEHEIRNMVNEAGLKIVDQVMMMNDKVVEIDAVEIERIEGLLDEMLEKAKKSSEMASLLQEVKKIKKMLKAHGIKRPRQLYLEAVV